MIGNTLNSNKMEINDKINNRTHHTRFFEKLYGNLESSSENVKEIQLVNHSHSLLEVGRSETLNSPSESSGSSSEIYSNEISAPRCEFNATQNISSCFSNEVNSIRNSMFASSSEIGLNGFPSPMMPSHFRSLRLPIGFTSDPHNHFAAFRKFGSIRLKFKRLFKQLLSWERLWNRNGNENEGKIIKEFSFNVHPHFVWLVFWPRVGLQRSFLEVSSYMRLYPI